MRPEIWRDTHWEGRNAKYACECVTSGCVGHEADDVFSLTVSLSLSLPTCATHTLSAVVLPLKVVHFTFTVHFPAVP